MGNNGSRRTPWWESLIYLALVVLTVYLTYPEEINRLAYRVRVRVAAPAADAAYTQRKLEGMRARYNAGGYEGDREQDAW